MVSSRHYFYVLYCQDDTLYAGYTNNLEQRFITHRAGKGAKYTKVKNRQPVCMIYAEEWDTKSLAMRQEYQFKQLSRVQKECYLFQNGIKSLKQNTCTIVRKNEVLYDSTTKL